MREGISRFEILRLKYLDCDLLLLIIWQVVISSGAIDYPSVILLYIGEGMFILSWWIRYHRRLVRRYLINSCGEGDYIWYVRKN